MDLYKNSGSGRMPAAVIAVMALFILYGILFSPRNSFPFGKNKVNREVFRWNILKTIHFDVYYPNGMEPLGEYSARIAEEGYVHIANTLNHELTQVIPIIIFPSHIEFQENNILLQIIGEGIGGFTEAFKNRVVVPFTGSYGELRHVLTHELVHAFQYNMLFDDVSGAAMSQFSYSGMPLWMMEGMSEYLSIGYDETADMVMRDVIYNDQYATLMDLTKLQVRSGYLIYKEGQAFYFFLEQKYGKEKIGELFRDIRDMGDFDEALKANAADKAGALQAEIGQFLKALETMHEKEQMVITYVPGVGTTVTIRGKDKVTIPGQPFGEAVFSMWLGPKPPNGDLKSGLLGKK